ncbi:hypothetical protein Patl1_14635 [Pistacia atlantica]|uniref:Uncharacterized protein n=1 Tax=Pistacia atlantica TaxID=434234 RepID=A0ACC1AXE1_9ROSI|nr:hypothetical protein Patl1_14635 [Pistacia atlantica]
MVFFWLPKEVASSFIVLESSLVRDYVVIKSSRKLIQGIKVNSLVLQKVGSVVSSTSRRFYLTNGVESQIVRLLYLDVDLLGLRLRPPNSNLDSSKEFQLRHIEGLRITLNNAGRLPINKLRDSNSSNIDFSELPLEDESQALLAQSLQSQAKKFKTMVAVVHASYLAGLSEHWNTPIPDKVKDLIGESVTSCKDDGDISNHMDKKRSLSNKPVMAVVLEQLLF